MAQPLTWRILAALVFVAVLECSTCLIVSAAPKAAYSTLCRKRMLSGESWRVCALLTVERWNEGAVKAASMNASSALHRFSGFLDPEVTIRVEPLGTFIGQDMVAEYLTIFSSPTGPVKIIEPLSINIRRYVGMRPIAVATVDYLFRNVYTQQTANLTVEQWFHFNEFNRVDSADFTIDRYSDFAPALGLAAVLAQTPNVGMMLVQTVCDTAAAVCATPALQQYNDVPSCMAFLAAIPLIDPVHIQSNTTICRFLHATLAPFAPQIHCPHIGPSGGGACVDVPYAYYFSKSPFKPMAFFGGYGGEP